MKTLAKLTLLGILAATSAQAEEGFYRIDQLSVSFDAASKQKASLVVEQLKSGQWKPIANAFFVSASGIALTNGHIANSCLYSNKARIEAEYGDLFSLYRKGYSAKKGQGLPCPNLRVTNDPANKKYMAVELTALAPIAEEEESSSPQTAPGPHYDFAALRVMGEEVTVPFLPLRRSAPSEVSVGSDVYLFGYPAKTSRQYSELVKAGKYDQVETGDYRVTIGKVLAVESDFFFQPNQDLFLYASTDGAPGSSGSALLSAKGNLLGLILGSGNGKATMAHGCNSRVDYCEGGAALYLRANHILDQFERYFPEFASELQ